LNHLDDHKDIISFVKSVSSNDSMSNVPKRLSTKVSSIDSNDQNIVATSTQSDENDTALIKESHIPTMISPTHIIAQQPTNTLISPSQTSVNISWTF
jgi:hypothetical protein